MEIKVMKNILGENDRFAAENQAMFQKAGVKLTPYTPSGRKAELEL